MGTMDSSLEGSTIGHSLYALLNIFHQILTIRFPSGSRFLYFGEERIKHALGLRKLEFLGESDSFIYGGCSGVTVDVLVKGDGYFFH